MKLPNGYGSIIKLGGKRRKKWAARITVNFEIDFETLQAKQKYKYIGYFVTKSEALEALAKYHSNPDIINNRSLTFEDIYEKWSKTKFLEISKSKIIQYKSAYKYCKALYKKSFSSLKIFDLQQVVDSCPCKYGTKINIVSMMNQMYDYAIKNDICEKKYSTYITVKNDSVIKTNVFTEDEINKLWKMSKNKDAQTILMLIYTGTRIGEMLNLKKENIYLKEQYFKVIQSKTKNGIREVPIADKILPFFKYFYENSKSGYLLEFRGNKITYSHYVGTIWKKYMKLLNLDYTPHTARKTCVSLLASANVNQTIIKKIVGHSGAMSLTERVYTKFDIKPLLEAINKI